MKSICEHKLNANFGKCVTGFHMLNKCPIKEAIWEDVNSLIFSSCGIDIYSKSDGSHLPGMDIDSSFGRLSNKSVKYLKNKKNIDISSYRLTNTCSENVCGNPDEIIAEIKKRKNFDYYSIIAREETSENISYDWFIIPSNHEVFNPSSFTWSSITGKRGKNKGVQVGWETNEVNGCKMTITFSMSSQLWIHINVDMIREFIKASVTVKNQPKLNYIELSDLF